MLRAISIVAAIIFIGVVILMALLPRFLIGTCGGSNESPGVANLRTINTAEVTYLSNAGSYGMIEDLIAARLLDETFAGIKSGYSYSVTLDAMGYTAEAVPAVVWIRKSWFSSATPTRGRYAYYSVPDAVVRYSMDASLAPVGQAGRSVQ